MTRSKFDTRFTYGVTVSIAEEVPSVGMVLRDYEQGVEIPVGGPGITTKDMLTTVLTIAVAIRDLNTPIVRNPDMLDLELSAMLGEVGSLLYGTDIGAHPLLANEELPIDLSTIDTLES